MEHAQTLISISCFVKIGPLVNLRNDFNSGAYYEYSLLWVSLHFIIHKVSMSKNAIHQRFRHFRDFLQKRKNQTLISSSFKWLHKTVLNNSAFHFSTNCLCTWSSENQFYRLTWGISADLARTVQKEWIPRNCSSRRCQAWSEEVLGSVTKTRMWVATCWIPIMFSFGLKLFKESEILHIWFNYTVTLAYYHPLHTTSVMCRMVFHTLEIWER